MSATFLLTGFEPFGEHRTNSSWEALEYLRERLPPDIVLQRLPVDHRAAHSALRRSLDDLRPAAVLCTGLAKGTTFRVEMRARCPHELRSGAEDEWLEGRWPWEEMKRALHEAHVDSVESIDAGRYVCESTYWSLLSYGTVLGGASPEPPRFAGFLHVPHESDLYPIPRIAEAVRCVVSARRLALLDAEPPLASGKPLAPP